MKFKTAFSNKTPHLPGHTRIRVILLNMNEGLTHNTGHLNFELRTQQLV